MKPTPYYSPFDLLGLSSEASVDLVAIRKARKRIMAEFELQGSAEITLKGQSFDKSSLLALFEDLESADYLALHQHLDAYTPARDFIITGNIAFFSPHQAEANASWFSALPEVKDFFTPFFVFQFNRVFLKTFRSNEVEPFKWLCQPLPVDLSHYKECYKLTYQYLQLEVDIIKDLATKINEGESPSIEVQEVCDEMRISVLNLLPDHFDGLRNTYGAALEDLALAVNNAHGRTKLAKMILRQGLKLSLSEAIRFNLQYILDQLMEISPDGETFWEDVHEASASTFGQKKHRWKWIVGGVLAVKLVFLFFRFLSE